MRIVWSGRARRDLTALLDYTAARSPRGARRIGLRILQRIGDLADMPHQGSLLPNDLRRLDITQTRYIVIFKLEKDEVRIVRILHGRRARRS